MSTIKKNDPMPILDADLDMVDGGALLLPAVQSAREAARRTAPAQDKLGNFEIQDLMSTFNQAET